MGEQYEFVPQCHHLRWLCEHLDGWQFGDQGLIKAIAEHLKLSGEGVEYGAGDGELLPLTIDPYYDAGKQCTLVEINAERRESLTACYSGAVVCATLNWASAFKKAQPSIVVIDIDGLDSVVMRDMFQSGVRPEILVVEHMDNHYPIGTTNAAFIPEWLLGQKLQSGLTIQDTAETLHAIAAKYGYERICVNRCNSYFARNDVFLRLLK